MGEADGGDGWGGGAESVTGCSSCVVLGDICVCVCC